MKTLNVTQVAALLFMHPVTVRNMARKGELPGTRIGRHWIFLEDEMLALLKQRTGPQPCEPPKQIGRPRQRVVGSPQLGT